ncbi:MAG: hypothetical protein Q4C96_03415 [Planctomycetia bacterium]|nr:hypothetical protein [Planctomycetia bacterium]
MAKIQGGSATILMEAEDRTKKAFQSVDASFKNFGKQLQGVEKTSKPLEKIFQSGLITSNAISNVGAYAQEFTTFGAAAQDLVGIISSETLSSDRRRLTSRGEYSVPL